MEMMKSDTKDVGHFSATAAFLIFYKRK